MASIQKAKAALMQAKNSIASKARPDLGIDSARQRAGEAADKMFPGIKKARNWAMKTRDKIQGRVMDKLFKKKGEPTK